MPYLRECQIIDYVLFQALNNTYSILKVAKPMDNKNSQSFADIKPSACLLRDATAVSTLLSTNVQLICLRKQSQQKQTCLLFYSVSMVVK